MIFFVYSKLAKISTSFQETNQKFHEINHLLLSTNMHSTFPSDFSHNHQPTNRNYAQLEKLKIEKICFETQDCWQNQR